MQFKKVCVVGFFCVAAFLTLMSCAHIPQESILLNDLVGKGIADQNSAYTTLLNEYFSVKRKAIDAFITESYVQSVFSSIRSTMKAEGESEIPDSVSQKIVMRIIAKRDSMQTSLEEVRVSILSKVAENAVLLSNANATVTALLRSAVSADQSTKKTLQTVDSLSGSKFKFTEFEKTFDQYLINVGTGAAKATDLYDKTNQFLNGGK